MDTDSRQNITEVTEATNFQHYGYGIAAVFTIFGNLVVFIMASTIKSLRKKPHVHFILFLSLSDTLVGVSVCMLSVSSITGYHEVSFCVLVQILQYSSFASSIVQTFFICLERCVAIRGRITVWFVPRRKNIYMLCNWVASVTLVTVVMVATPKPLNVDSCRIEDLCGIHWQIPSVLFGVVCTIMLLLVSTLYLRTVFAIVRRIRATSLMVVPELPPSSCINTNQGSGNQSGVAGVVSFSKPSDNINIKTLPRQVSTQNRNPGMPGSYQKGMRRTFVTVTIILVEYVICYGPASVLLVLRPYVYIPLSVRAVCFTLPVLNSFTNPILYAWRLRDFRTYLRFTCRSTGCYRRQFQQ